MKRPFLQVTHGDGKLSNFTALKQHGATSTTYIEQSQEFVLKVQYPQIPALRREMCIYRRLRDGGVGWTPRMVCADNAFALIMMYAGAPLD